MLQIKVGVQLASLRLPFRQALHMAARLGAQAVEIDARNELRPADLSHTGVREIRKMLADLNLQVSCLSFRTRRGYEVIADLEQRIEATRQVLKLAYDLGTNVVVNSIGHIPADQNLPAWGVLTAALTEVGRYGQRVGATLAAETGPDSGPELAKLIAALPPGSIGVDLHPANLIAGGHSPREAVQALGDQILHVHATDATRDLSRGRTIVTALGQGSAEFPEILAVLEEHQYRGFITIERGDSSQPVVEIGQAVEFLRNL